MTMWQNLIDEILELEGYSIPLIASQIDASITVISRLHEGDLKEPKHQTGNRLLALHLRLRPELYGANRSPLWWLDRLN